MYPPNRSAHALEGAPVRAPFRSSILALSAVLLLCLTAGGAHAYCRGRDPSRPEFSRDFYSIAGEYRRSKYVAIVTVRAEHWLDDDGKPTTLKPPFRGGARKPWGFDPYMGVRYDVEVVKRFKGRPPRRLTLYTENSAAHLWMDVGRSYLGFIAPERFEGVGAVLALDNCGNSKLVEHAPATLKVVQALAKGDGGGKRGKRRP